MRILGSQQFDRVRDHARHILRTILQSGSSYAIARSVGEVNHAGSFLCRYCDRVLCPAVGFYQGLRTPVGGFNGIRDCWNRRGISVRLFNVRPASA